MGKIIWLASYPKSGNTWLRVFLHNLLSDAAKPCDINDLARFTCGDSGIDWYGHFDQRPLKEITKEEIAALRPKVHEMIVRSSPQVAFVKTHNALVKDRGTPMITLHCTAAAIYLVRNPLDVVISHANHYGLSFERSIETMNTPGHQTDNTEHQCYEFHGSWSEHVRSWTSTPGPGLCVIRYEDMLERPAETFGGVAKFLRLDASRERLERAIEHGSFRVLQEQEERHGFRERSENVEQFFRVGKSGQWRKLLTRAQVEAVTSVHRDQMARFGYWPLAER